MTVMKFQAENVPPLPHTVSAHAPYHWPHIHILETHFHALSPYLHTMELTCIWTQSSNHVTHNGKSTSQHHTTHLHTLSPQINSMQLTCLLWTENSSPCNPHWRPQLSTMRLACTFQVQHHVPPEPITQQDINLYPSYAPGLVRPFKISSPYLVCCSHLNAQYTHVEA
jgi:hypothetical protein